MTTNKFYKYDANSITESMSMLQFNLILNLLNQWKPSSIEGEKFLENDPIVCET